MQTTKVAVFIVTTFLAWLLFDAWLGPNGGPTESQLIRQWGKVSTFFPFLMGCINGHWFFGRKQVDYSAWGYCILFWALLILWDIWWAKNAHAVQYPWFRFSGGWFILGILTGCIYWAQSNVDSPI